MKKKKCEHLNYLQLGRPAQIKNSAKGKESLVPAMCKDCGALFTLIRITVAGSLAKKIKKNLAKAKRV